VGDGRPGLDPAIPYDNAGRTVKDRLDELHQRVTTLKSLQMQTQDLLTSLSEPGLISFFDRKKTMGEVEALKWALSR
jgi:hypothetical protein